MDRAWLTFISFTQDFAILAALLIFLSTTRSGRRKFNMIGWVLGVTLLVEITQIIGFWVFHLNMNFASLFLEVIVVPLYFLFYRSKMSSPTIRTVLIILMIISSSFALVNALFLQGINDIREYSNALVSFVLILYSIIYLYMLMKDLPAQLATRLPMFWINTAVLVYYSCALMIYLLTEYVLTALKGDIIVIWFVHNIMGIFHYTMIGVGLWTNRSLYKPLSAV